MHLLRASNDLAYLERFLTSYRAMRETLPHDLIVVFKGFENHDKRAAIDLLADIRHTAVEVDDSGFDIGPYLHVARHAEYQRMCFLNSFSRILAPDWLTHLASALEKEDKAGLVGATGSWEPIGLDTPFPNYHIRTTGFLIERALLLDLDAWEMREKFDANRFEAGPNSLTRQVLSRGLEPYVVDRNGRAFAKEDWEKSRTFRAGEQDGLLIADRRSDAYHAAKRARRAWHSGLAWSRNPVKKEKLSRRLRRMIGFPTGR